MSDLLLERIAKAAEGLLAHLQKSPASSGGATRPAAAAPVTPPKAAAADPAKAAAAAKAVADAKTAAAAKVAAAAAKKAPAAGAKAPGGKYTVEQVRDIVRQVATNPGLGRQSAADILDQDGGGVTKVTDLKPENFDKVYEACQVLLSGEGDDGAPASEPEDDLM